MYGIEKKKLQKLSVWNGNLNPTFECTVLENSTIEQWIYGIDEKKKLQKLNVWNGNLKFSTWMYGIEKFCNWTMDIWNWQKIKNGMCGLDIPLRTNIKS
jgi:hypothetical protein